MSKIAPKAARAALPLLALLTSAAAVAQHRLPAESVVVTANASPVPFENLAKTVTVLDGEDIAALPAHSITDVLAQAASVDLESRGPFGAQADIKLRGSAYSQTLVLIDGVRMNDSQTGHHNADFPVPLQAIERIEVLLGPGSSIYGADAFGGIINIITKRETAATQASVSGGMHGYVAGSFSAGFGNGRIGQSVSVAGERSGGFMEDRDFRNVTVSSRTNIGEDTSLFVSHGNKEFGAYGFYGPSPSREWTNQTMLSFERKHRTKGGAELFLQGFYRTHGDHFLYNQDTPGVSENRHRTHATGVLAKARLALGEAAALTFGADFGGDWIFSNNLGDHAFARQSGFGELQWNLGGKAAVYPGVRIDRYSNFGTAVSPSLSGSWWASPRLRLRAAVGKAFRIPTFQERYYFDPNNVGNPDVKPEKAWSAEVGADVIPAEGWSGGVTAFTRRERDVIDWIRVTDAEKWRTANIHRLRTDGVELSLERAFGDEAAVGARYSYISSDAGEVSYISKYVLDYARHTVASTARLPLFLKLRYSQTLSYKRRSDGRSYWLWDTSLERPFHKLVVGIDFANLLDSRYQEIQGVDMPGRWLAVRIGTR
ncbi:MAG: TonB-dependent receptor [Acidobacteriota bacterium]|jgi:iron complex outermembrane receptor protein|nr:TonB-dependent receptor [Acidobacteriota bacterium]